MSAREQWEDVSFQVFEDVGGAIRSGYYPTGAGLVSGNVAVDYAYGNFPIQPNDDRNDDLSVGDSHNIPFVVWNLYPSVANARNYMVTGAEYLGGVLYEYTAQNNLVVGDLVKTTNCPGYNGTANVVYADATKFRVENELGGTAKLTGLTGRATVLDSDTGHSLDNGDSFYWPELWPCGGANFPKIEDVISELVSCGVPANYFKDMTFNGGETKWDASQDDPNWDGCILYSYIPANSQVGTNGAGMPIYGSDMDGRVIGSEQSSGNKIATDTGYVEDYMIYVLSNDPRKNNVGWWW